MITTMPSTMTPVLRVWLRVSREAAGVHGGFGVWTRVSAWV
jgi:hypothetical protein